MSFQRRSAALPWPIVLVLYVVAMTALLSVVDWATERPDLPPWLGAVLGVVLALVFVARRARLRAQGRWEPMQTAGEALRAGRVPAARAELVRMLPLARMGSSGLVRWIWVFYAPFGLLTAYLALDEPRRWAQVAFFVALTAVSVISVPRQRRRLESVDQVLRSGV